MNSASNVIRFFPASIPQNLRKTLNQLPSNNPMVLSVLGLCHRSKTFGWHRQRIEAPQKVLDVLTGPFPSFYQVIDPTVKTKPELIWSNPNPPNP